VESCPHRLLQEGQLTIVAYGSAGISLNVGTMRGNQPGPIGEILHEILDFTFAMNNGWAKTREDCAQLIIYKTPDQISDDPIYHPTVVGEDFLRQTGVMGKFGTDEQQRL
jgi:hypothetical protein